jgi:hypothetical protein
VWVVPADGTIVRTRLQLRGFTDLMTQGESRTSPDAAAPSMGMAGGTARGGGRAGMGEFPEFSSPNVQSTADIEVTYKKDEKVGMWLPAQMTEEYQGQIPWTGRQPITAIARSRATYSDYKQFGTSATFGIKR